ncbi:hypothetical protein JG687_00014828 [Phytophthora cactorum]|uniref:Uncharacterized protein n=3 Tax=Phytophthora cactorum TaxID=29920 RepID=A0A8T1U0H3_9STRA|nr:hypothetical protein JG687_00014828 [Phytophthora cactorum]
MYRQRAKNKRASLRDEVALLTDQLTRLSQASSDGNDIVAIQSTSAWKVLALCNRHKLTEAEADKKRLLAAVSSQELLIEEISSVVRKLMNRVPAVCSVNLQDVCVLEQRKDMELYNAYLTELDSNFSRTASVLSTQGVESMSESVIKAVSVARYGNSRIYTIKCGIAKRVMCRAQRTHDSMVIMWKAFVEGEEAFKGMNSSESGYIRLRPSEAGSMMEMYVHQVPVWLSSTQSDDSRVAQFLEVVLDVGQENEEHALGGIASLFLEKDGLEINEVKTERLSVQQLKVESG